MGSPALIGFEMGSREKAAREDEQRQAQLQNIATAGLSPEQQRDAIQQLYAKDPSALKRHVENLFGRLVGRKPQPVAPAYAPQSVTSQPAPLTLPAETEESSLSTMGRPWLNTYSNPEDQPPSVSYGLNKTWSRPGPYTTHLSPQEERQFQQWVTENRIPWRDSPTADYDMRGYWKALINPNDPNHSLTGRVQNGAFKGHFSDKWKTPYSGVFSRESMYATPNAPYWDGDRLVTADGRVVTDETPGSMNIPPARRLTLPAPAPVTVNYPGAKTHAERLAQDLSGGKTKEQQALDLFNQESAAQEDAKLSGAQKMFQWYQGLTPEQQRIAGPMLGIRTPEDLKLYRLSTGQTVYLNAADPASIPAGAEPVATGAAAQGPSLVSLGGVPMAVKDPQTGKTYSKQQIESGNVPEDVAALWKSGNEAYQTAQTTKQKQFDREQQAILNRQEISNNNMLSRMAIQFRNMLSAGSFRAATATVEKLQQAYSTSVTLDARMKQLEPEALKGNQQAMLAILANHIAMTTHQPGAAMRPTKELFDEAAATQPWMDKITKSFDADGVLSGVKLSPEQIKQMVGLAPIMVQADKDALEQTKSMLSDALNPQFNGQPAPKQPPAKNAASDPLGVM